MANFFETVLDLLKKDDRFVAEDGSFLRNAVYEAAMKMDGRILRLLLSNDETRTRFFTDVDGVKVFDKTGFAWVINNRQFLPDSYTRYKNAVGLADENSELLSSSGRVELVFPYKDCVLEGGQTKEDQKRQEIFYNETLA
ncbi:MAG: site-specific DNA-methyltransferase, partial [Oscillospiraceae bacterium]|nr:site-specific DNA-methyltransferase [Oscillospiraceae bacterium]